MADVDRWVSLGRLGRAHGVRGWCWIRSDCDPAEALFDYAPLRLRLDGRELNLQIEQSRQLPKGLLAKVSGFDTPEAVQAWAGALIETPRSALPEGEGWYWTDLEGLQVCNQDGVDFGRVSHLFDAGGGTVMVVQGERERLLPFVMDQVVRRVDLEARRIDVDWDADF
ncbi:MAG: 16S rRNA processing protein RimM [Xanthomonadales bacterium]|nr:16S rRNA processing protein RimM [Xanthomonadales bacterium]